MDFLRQILYQCLTEQILFQTYRSIMIIIFFSVLTFLQIILPFNQTLRKTFYIYYYYSYNYNELLLTLSLHFSDLHGKPKYFFDFLVNFSKTFESTVLQLHCLEV